MIQQERLEAAEKPVEGTAGFADDPHAYHRHRIDHPAGHAGSAHGRDLDRGFDASVDSD